MKPNLEEMLPDRNSPNLKGEELWASTQAQALWDQARGELLGFANHLERGKATITADQIRMAVAGVDGQQELKSERDALRRELGRWIKDRRALQAAGLDCQAGNVELCPCLYCASVRALGL